MKFYFIKDNYINYLRLYDSNIAYNKSQKRPYIGVLLSIDNKRYYAPLSSPKKKHLKMKNKIDFIKIEGGKYGIINLNNMIPVLDNCLIPIDFDKIDDVKYKYLLFNQYFSIKKSENKIITNAIKLREIILSSVDSLNPYLRSLKCRSSNLRLLEDIYILYDDNFKY